jgi:hypothetical protein
MPKLKFGAPIISTIVSALLFAAIYAFLVFAVRLSPMTSAITALVITASYRIYKSGVVPRTAKRIGNAIANATFNLASPFVYKRLGLSPAFVNKVAETGGRVDLKDVLELRAIAEAGGQKVGAPFFQALGLFCLKVGYNPVFIAESKAEAARKRADAEAARNNIPAIADWLRAEQERIAKLAQNAQNYAASETEASRLRAQESDEVATDLEGLLAAAEPHFQASFQDETARPM